MKKLLFLSFILLSLSAYSQNEPLLKPGRVIFYNVENLFDTINDPETSDNDFTPDGKNEWNTKKYEVKLNHLSKVLAALLDTIQPMVVGLCEIENRKVLEDLVAQPELQSFNLWIIHHDSPDERGIDVAFLYKPQIMKVAFDSYLKVEFPFDSIDNTRNIHYMKVYLNEGEPVWFFVNHWPSRLGGKEQSDAKRAFVAKILKDKIENIYLGEPFARVVVMGDLNDNPNDSSVGILSAAISNSKAEAMVNLMKPMQTKQEFTLKYKEESDIFDQFIVSKNLLDNRNPMFIRDSAAHIFSPEWILYKHNKYGMIPNRTYTSGRWVGGYSDHLPVYFDIVIK